MAIRSLQTTDGDYGQSEQEIFCYEKYITRLLLIQLFLLFVYSATAQKRMYRGSKLPRQSCISGIIEGPKEMAAGGITTAELFLRSNLHNPLQTFYVNNYTGKFRFIVDNGFYMVVIKSQGFDDKQIIVDVLNADVNLDRIKLFRLLGN